MSSINLTFLHRSDDALSFSCPSSTLGFDCTPTSDHTYIYLLGVRSYQTKIGKLKIEHEASTQKMLLFQQFRIYLFDDIDKS